MKPTPVQFEYTQYAQLTVDTLAKAIISFVEVPQLYDISHSFRNGSNPFEIYNEFQLQDKELQATLESKLNELLLHGYGIDHMSRKDVTDNNQSILGPNGRYVTNPNYQKYTLRHFIFTMKRTVTVAQVGELINDMNDLTME